MGDIFIVVGVITGILCFFCFMVVLVTIARTGASIKGMIHYYKIKPVYQDWIAAGFITIGIVASLAFLNKAVADPISMDYFTFTEIHFGLDVQSNNPVCRDDSVDELISANIGVRQQVLGADLPIGRVDGVLSYTHHSCAIGSDAKGGVYDGLGMMMVYRVEW